MRLADLVSGTPTKKEGGPLTPKRSAIAFVITPKLPLSGKTNVRLLSHTDFTEPFPIHYSLVS